MKSTLGRCACDDTPTGEPATSAPVAAAELRNSRRVTFGVMRPPVQRAMIALWRRRIQAPGSYEAWIAQAGSCFVDPDGSGLTAPSLWRILSLHQGTSLR